MTGKIIKGIGGFYYVHCKDDNLYECRAKGIFRKEKIKPLVGDDVEISILDEAERLGNLDKILPRKSELVRPAVANVDQAMIIFAVSDPMPNLNLLDRFLLMMNRQKVKTIVVFSKSDLVSQENLDRLLAIYEKCGNEVLGVSAKEEWGIEHIRRVLQEKTTVIAGPSGVGKSTVVNLLYPEAQMETGEVSEKIRRGKHTTRHSELFCIEQNAYIMDTPGFSSLAVPDMEKEELKKYFTEFLPYEGMCRFMGCEHVNEPDCEIKRRVEDGTLSKSRYENYVQMFEEVKERKKY